MSVSNVIQVIADHIEPKIYTQKDFVRSISGWFERSQLFM